MVATVSVAKIDGVPTAPSPQREPKIRSEHALPRPLERYDGNRD